MDRRLFLTGLAAPVVLAGTRRAGATNKKALDQGGASIEVLSRVEVEILRRKLRPTGLQIVVSRNAVQQWDLTAPYPRRNENRIKLRGLGRASVGQEFRGARPAGQGVYVDGRLVLVPDVNDPVFQNLKKIVVLTDKSSWVIRGGGDSVTSRVPALGDLPTIAGMFLQRTDNGLGNLLVNVTAQPTRMPD